MATPTHIMGVSQDVSGESVHLRCSTVVDLLCSCCSDIPEGWPVGGLSGHHPLQQLLQIRRHLRLLPVLQMILHCHQQSSSQRVDVALRERLQQSNQHSVLHAASLARSAIPGAGIYTAIPHDIICYATLSLILTFS